MTAFIRQVVTRAALALTAFAGIAVLPAAAQTSASPFPITIEKQLAARASDYTEVTLDRRMLDFASHFMKNEDDAEGKRIIANLNGIYVRTYEFDKPGQYTPEDLEAIRRQFQSSEWNPIVRERSKNATDDSDIYMKLVNGEIRGMFILNAEAKELDFVYIDGPIRPEDLASISGNFGIPADAYKNSVKEQKSSKEAVKKATKDDQKAGKEAPQP